MYPSDRLVDIASPDLCEALSRLDIHTAHQILVADMIMLSRQSGIPIVTLERLQEKIVQHYIERTSHRLYQTAYEAYQQHQINILNTGYDSIDQLLGGGIRCGEVTELFGPAGVGKTQIAFSVMAQTLLKDTSAKVVYIDINHSFSAQRVYQLMSRSSVTQADIASALERLYVWPCQDIHQLLTMLDMMYTTGCTMHRSESLPTLLVIDTISTLITPLLSNIIRQGHVLMASLARILKDLAYDGNMAVLVMNGSVRAYEEVSGPSDTPTTLHTTSQRYRPALGMTWMYTPNIRLLISRDGESWLNPQRRCTLVRSPRMPLCHTPVTFSLIAEKFA